MTEALFLCGPRDARVAPFNLREGRSNEVLIEVAAVGICGSDLHYYKDGGSGSHSCRATSSAAPFATTFRARPCARRVWWRWTPTSRAPLRLAPQGYFNLCPNVQFFGAPPFDGAMTARLWAPTSQIVKLPPALTPLDAVMLEPLGVAMHAVDHPIGLLILQVLKAAGAGEICVIEPQAHRREMAIRFGAAAVGESLADVFGRSEGKGFPPGR